VFGCYGWSGESTKVLSDLMLNAGFEVIDEGFRNQWNPDNYQQLKAIEHGKNITNK